MNKLSKEFTQQQHGYTDLIQDVIDYYGLFINNGRHAELDVTLFDTKNKTKTHLGFYEQANIEIFLDYFFKTDNLIIIGYDFRWTNE